MDILIRFMEIQLSYLADLYDNPPILISGEYAISREKIAEYINQTKTILDELKTAHYRSLP